MAKIIPNIFLKLLYICFLLNSFSLVLSREINYDPNKDYVEETINEASSLANDFLLKFGSGVTKPDYIKITLTPKEGQETPHLCYSPTSSDCSKDRIIMATRVDKLPAIACVKSSEISGTGKNLNALVTCKTNKCGFTIRFEKADRCVIDAEKGTVYSYIATLDNRNMDFEVKGISQVDTLMQIGLEGSKDAKVTIDDNYVDSKNLTSVKYDGAQFHSYKIGKEQKETATLTKFSVKSASIGDYIRITVYTVNDYKGPDNLLYPGGPAVMGLVHKTGEPIEEICLPISALAEEFKDTAKYYLTGKIYSQYALFWPANKKGEYDEDIELEIADGLLSYVLNTNGEKKSVCFEFSYIETVEKKDVVFSVQLIPLLAKTSDFNINNPPMMIGQPYRYMLEKGKSLVYHGGQILKADERFSFNVFSRIGLINVYVDECDNFPNCKYDMDPYSADVAKMESVANTGKFYLYDRKVENDMEVFGQKKKVMIIQCIDDGNTDGGYCEFDAAVYTKSSVINLVEKEQFAKYVVKGDKGTFQMNFNGAVKLLSLGVEIMVHSGEVIFDGKTSDEGSEPPTKYILSNKVFFHFHLYRRKYSNINIEYTAIKNSFFTIKYVYYRDDVANDFIEEIIYPGESYLVQMDPMQEYKIIHMENNRYKTSQKFLINFFALNCEFKVTTNKTAGAQEVEVPFADGYAQDIVGPELGQIYKSDYINYRITIENAEDSNYDKKMCMIYVAGLQSPEVHFIPRIVTGNNINQQIILNENFKSISLLYPTPDVNKDLVVYLNVIDKAFYYLEINANKAENHFLQESITTSKPYYLKKGDIKNKCQNKDDYSFCNILITVENFNSIEDFPRTNPMIEITVREAIEEGDYTLLRVPTYLQKGIAKRDFTTGDGYYYYYTDIGKNDQGDVLVNFIRDYGEVYGRIVKKDTRDESAEIEWMDMYRLPGEEWIIDDDHYNKYLKKYHISLEDTEDCIVGCYLIIGVRISQIGEYAEDWKFYPFSIVTQINQAAYGQAEVNIITIQVDEFVVGNVDISKNVKISQYYQVWLPRDTYQIQFDWQSELAGLYISIDGNLPTAANADFVLLPNGLDSIKTIDKIEILDKLKEKGIKEPEDLEDFRLIIGIWTDKTDSANTELYSLRVHEAFLAQFDLDIVEVNTDQKILCKPTRISETKWRCLFMVTYDDQDVIQGYDLLVYARSTDRGDTSEMYGNFIYANSYNAFIADILRNSTPTYEQAELNSVRDSTSYFYIKLGSKPHHKNQFLYINVVTTSNADIMMVASLNSYDTEKLSKGVIFYPSPHTEQIVQTNGTLELQFSINTSLIVNIESLGGEADTYWEEDSSTIHYFRGKGDRLTLTSGKSYDKLILKMKKSDAKQQDLEPGFVFIVDYYERNPSKNFDEVVYGNSIEIGYSNTDLPINLYSKHVDVDSDLNLAVTFRDSHVEKEGEYTTSPLEIRAFLDKRDNIYNAKTIPEFEPSINNRKLGIYDPSIKTAQVTISTIEIENIFNIAQEDEPTILFHVGKSKAYEYKSYNTFNVETQFTKSNSRVVPTEKVYNYGKVIGPVTLYYKLKHDTTKKLMKIVLSFNGNGLSWSLGDYQNAHENTTRYPIKAESSRGKITITIEPGLEEFIYLNFWKTDSSADISPQILNYAFEYLNLESEDQFFNYQIYGKDGSIEYKEVDSNGNKTITCTFNRIDVPDNQANVTYFLKIADVINYIEGENFQTVAVTETPCYIKYIRNPSHSNNKITLSATGDFKYWNYIQVTAQIQQNKALDYVAYNGVKIDKENPYNSDKNTDGNPKDTTLNKTSKTGLIIGISVALVIIIIGLVGVIFYFQKKNKSLMDQVKHVSFQQNSSAASDPDLLLHKDQSQAAPSE